MLRPRARPVKLHCCARIAFAAGQQMRREKSRASTAPGGNKNRRRVRLAFAVPHANPVILDAPRPAKKCVRLANLRGARRTGIV
jgi:hypothetical protein